LDDSQIATVVERIQERSHGKCNITPIYEQRVSLWQRTTS